MGRTIDQDVYAAFAEFRGKETDKCISVQCLYCHQTRAKNTSRQKAHLLECRTLQNTRPSELPPELQKYSNAYRNEAPSDPFQASSALTGMPRASALATQNNLTTLTAAGPAGYGAAANLAGPAASLNNAIASHGPAMPTGSINGVPARPSLPQQSSSSGGGRPTTPLDRPIPTPKAVKTTPKTAASLSLPAPPLDDVHAAFVEFRNKEEDKCLSVQCIYCSQIRAKNTSRQRQHLQECQTYLNVMKESIPANNLQHRFDEGEVARSLQIPMPELVLDFRMSVKLNPKVSVGPGIWGQRNWISFVGGSWAGRWGKGIVIPGGQDSQLVMKDLSAHLSANYLLQTNDDPPAYITVKSTGWRTGPKEVLEKLADPMQADTIPASAYKFRLTLQLETGDERYPMLNTGMWIGCGCRRGSEVIYDAYRFN